MIKEKKGLFVLFVSPALHDVGGSFCKSLSSLRIRFDAMLKSKERERERERLGLKLKRV